MDQFCNFRIMFKIISFDSICYFSMLFWINGLWKSMAKYVVAHSECCDFEVILLLNIDPTM